MFYESSNQIYGRALNPWNKNRTTGGSSGGEAGLVAARASPLGIGSDIGGSIRVPCTFCGVYGIKPTPARISFKGVKTAFVHNFEPLDVLIPASIGPIGKCVEDLALVLKTWWKESDKGLGEDWTIPFLKFDENTYENTSKKLKIGYFSNLPYFDSAVCIKKAIEKCVKELETSHEIVLVEFPNVKPLIKLFTQAINANGNKDILKALQGETPEAYYNLQIFSNNHPWLTKIGLYILKLLGNTRVTDFIGAKGNISQAEYIELCYSIQDEIEIFTKYWENLNLDALICPVFGIVAPFHDTALDVLPACCYSVIWNVLGYPAGVVPVGLVQAEDVEFFDQYNDVVTKAAKKSMKNSEGIPFGLQVVSLPFKDEQVLNVMKLVESVFEFHQHPI